MEAITSLKTVTRIHSRFCYEDRCPLRSLSVCTAPSKLIYIGSSVGC